MPTSLTQSQKSRASKSLDLKTYVSLRSAVRETIALGKQRAIRAVDRERVRTAWEAGKLIQEHILLNQSRADYGKKVIERLSKDIGISKSEINRMVEFYESYRIGATSRQLSWSHYRELLAVNDVKKRTALEKRADKEDWTVPQLRAEIKRAKLKMAMGSGGGNALLRETLKPVSPGALNVYRTRELLDGPAIDLGFSTYREKRSVKKKIKIVKDRNFTYRALVERVVDGDTLWCVVYLGLGEKARQRLRLKGIDAPELKTKAGQRAKRYLSRKLPRGTKIILSTRKTDKWDRYLIHLWLGKTYINQLLIDKGHAVRV